MTGRPLAGVVLCGGRGSRMGADKALLQFEGEPLVRRVARTLGEVADPVLLASGAPGRLATLGLPEVADPRPDRGPLAGLVAGLAASPHDLVAAVAVDLPFASSSLLRWMAEAWEGEDAAVPETARGPEPL